MTTKDLLPRLWLWIKKIFLFLFIAQFIYIILLKWINPPITITQFVSWISGDGLKRDYSKAMKYNERKPGRIRGASTISQQVAKNVFLWQGRSWLRKGLETYFTFMIELIWSKKRILQMYLNVSEMGTGIFGIERAANIYFNKPALSLSRQEAAMIAACLPSPKRFKVKPASNYVMARSRRIMQQMNFLQPDPDIQAVINTATRKSKI